ncbi:Transcriptional regulator, XRE family OS=Tsukamurella paurometabola (strain ATCC 8368 / DSM/ CCUG 35730 / CIP 100753 / JCM 10117 / KCTC 9821 / NBRC 16120/ NCIMB 702349 / NCTC 13040) OX=521096 GN=Tpau_2441 PE=4 SV=1 [Tsukamurella paurometabola]|uniref:Transcriptional regulator, XRE family n=1 Tax=Tsukamurella paurometabola (strain ATCC 8368 / DSM 20162 / CCUG 35730 / CIP 100753 / JCM 10117 / KCTC 9821 / NBRC 16120 / NCIMB 702349 / NCTC 13040) TaxID=521096 RepID=D5UR57_TSUPD|nr:helix-turn-helix transcriptional regulator [Tsukamurella paurometabola]ADG79046.1 transcriptional regulator, XRE family [Tsukamurella paurometabola DSM 20162]SUP33883.1 Helix-turn-helix [Tsukamurella paurometabola]
MSGPQIDWESYGDSLAYRLLTLRKARGISQEKLAERAGLHRNQISNIERNVSSGDRFSDPHMSTLYRLAAALDVPPALLLPDADRRVAPRSAEQDGADAAATVESSLLVAIGE